MPVVEREIERVVPAVLPYDYLQRRHHHRQGRACDQARGDRTGRLRRHRGAGRSPHRRPADRAPAAPQWSPDGACPACPSAPTRPCHPGRRARRASSGPRQSALFSAGVVARGAVRRCSPFGPVRPYDAESRRSPSTGPCWGSGSLRTRVVVLWTLAVVFAVPARTASRLPVRSAPRVRPSKLADARAAAAAGTGAGRDRGSRFALQSRTPEPTAVPMRSAILERRAGRGRSDRDRRLRFQPRFPGGTPGPLRMELELRAQPAAAWRPFPPPSRRRCSAKTGRSPRWSGYYFANLQIDGLTVPVLGATPHSAVRARRCSPGTGSTPPIRSCWARSPWPNSGSPSVASSASRTSDAPDPLRIVGTATMPTVGIGGVTSHLTVGTGAIVPSN